MAFTYFFRDMQTLELITQHALPVLRGHRYIDIWDAGCAHGPEPYSIAIMLRENMGQFLFRNVRIFATDIDGSDRFGEMIARGVYPEQEVKRIPKDILQKYFSKADSSGQFEIDDEIKASVSFTRHDLLSLKPFRTGIGLIVCKNVLLHFNKNGDRTSVLRMFHSALRDGGFLVTEQTQKLPEPTEDLFERVTADGQVFMKAAPSPISVQGDEELSSKHFR